MSDSNSIMNQCLRAVWQRAQRKHAAAGVMAFASWFVPLFVAVIIIDRYAYFPGWLRSMIAPVILAVPILQAWRHGWSRLQRYNATRTAQQIERANGSMDSLLVTAVEFQERGVSPGTSAAMWELTARRAQEAAAEVKAQQVVNLRDLQKPLRMAAAVVGMLLLIAVINGSFLKAGLGRMFTPWLAIAYPTDTLIELGEDELVVQEGAAATIEIRLSGEIPGSAEIALKTGKGEPREIELEVVDGVCRYEISSASRDFSYRIKAGDARSDWLEVRVIPAPRLARVNVELDFPDYIERDNQQLAALTLTVPEETKIGWQLTLDTPIRKATLHRDGVEDLPLMIGEDGRTLTLTDTASASRGYSFSWTEDRHGFDFTSPRYFLQVASDQAPRVELTTPEGNVTAMLGRPLPLAVRAQDDHGIGSTTITYRVNRRPEKTVVMPEPVSNGEGEQVLDWDYRKELADLQVGDTVSFVVEVADRYPGDGGPHRVRTDSRRITFLSREDYLAEITKQMERLLTRVRTLYRQERAAHELVLALDPQADSFLPTCQLEAIRQEMIREQLVTTANEMQALLDDLAANQVSDAVESDALAALRDAMRTIAADHVARAADLLRAQVGADKRDPEPAIAAVNQAARELAGLVLLRDINAAREVFARETHMLARELARLRLRLIISPPDQAEALAKAHEELAGWTEELLDKLSAGMHYDKKPLAVLSLNRRIHALRTGGLSKAIREAAALAANGEGTAAAAAQYPLIRPLLEGEFTMRAGSEYALIKNLGARFEILIADQQQLHEACAGAGELDAQLLKRQVDLHRELVLAPLPTIQAPRSRLFDLALPPLPPADELRLKAEALMLQAQVHLKAGEKDALLATQKQAIVSLGELDAILERWSRELAQKSLGASADISDATDRLGVIEQLENRQIVLLDQTEEAALDEKNPPGLLEEQQALLDELATFRKELTEVDGGPDRSLLPLNGRLGAVQKAMTLANDALKQKRAEESLDAQEKAAELLAQARSIAAARLSQLNLMQQLIGFEQAVGKASEGMGDIVGGQNDLIAATKVADEKSLPALLAPQRNLLACLSDIAPSLDLVAERMDVGTPLVFAASDVEDALLAMEDGDGEDAADIQQTAVESLAKVRGLVAEISVQTGYVAEIVEYLQQAQSDAAMLAFRQTSLREGGADENAVAAQRALASDAEAYGELLTEVAGCVEFDKLPEAVKEKMAGADLTLDFNTPAVHMQEAAKLLQAGQPAVDAMLAAEQALQTRTSQIFVIIEMLNGLPSLTLTKASPAELQRLIKVLDIASKQRRLMREINVAADKDLPAFAAAQAKLTKLAGEVARFGEEGITHPLLDAALQQLSPVEQALAAGRKQAAAAQLAADQTLRHFIIEQALILNTAIPPASSSNTDVVTESETDDLYEADAVGFLSEFVSGEAPKDKESEWEILGERNRAALNQNFARELPLEFRATLKDYYERVAK